MRRLVPPLLLLPALLAACSIDRPVASDDARFDVHVDSSGADTATTTALRLAAFASLPNRGARRPLNYSRVSTNPTLLQFVTRVSVIDPWAIAVTAGGTAVVSNLTNATVTFINVPAAQVLGMAPTGDIPTDIALTSDGSTAFVASQDGTITVLDVNTRQVLRTLAVPATTFFSVAVSATNGALYAGTAFGDVYQLDPQTGAVLRQANIGSAVNGLAVNAAGSRVYATNMFGGTLVELDATTLTTTRPLLVIGGVTQDVVVSPAGDRAFVANEAGFITDVNLATGAMVNIPTAGGAFGLVTPPSFALVGVIGPTLGYQVYQVTPPQLRRPFAQIPFSVRRGAFHASTRWIGITSPGTGTVDFFR
ncbi:MAG: YncE family protein [Gemmatimonadetes bacterium]|nr:YncE family protein [Gemmatimonadota bacterium]